RLLLTYIPSVLGNNTCCLTDAVSKTKATDAVLKTKATDAVNTCCLTNGSELFNINRCGFKNEGNN
ncbi:hypothetical protein FRX31_032569, partial [Thalictrum thalictroides]